MPVHNIFSPKYETIAPEELKALQLRRLQDTVMRVYYRVPFYRKKMDDLGVTPDDIRSLDDIRRLPFTTKADLRDNYPFGLFRRSGRRGCTDTRLLRNHGQTDGGGLYRPRSQYVAGTCRTDGDGSRDHECRHGPDRFRLRPFHRRFRPPLWLRTGGRVSDTGIFRQYGAPV